MKISSYGVVDGSYQLTTDFVHVILINHEDESIYGYYTIWDPEFDAPITLDSILDYVKINFPEVISFRVLAEDPLYGMMFRYGAYTHKYWEFYGETRGYA